MIAGQGKLIVEEESFSVPMEVAEPPSQALDPDHEYVVSNGGGTSVWQYWDGAAWTDYPQSAAGQTSLAITPPPSGRVRLNVTAGSSVVSVYRRAWRS